MTQVGRRRLSLFSFGSNNSSVSNSAHAEALDQKLDTDKPEKAGKSDSVTSTQSSGGKLSLNTTNDQLSSPIHSPISEDGSDLNIFERSVQDNGPMLPNSRRPTITRLKSNQRASSSISLSNFKTEDYVPPALDATTQFLSDSKTNLDDVEMIYSSRRNSSVMGLSMALGRTTPSRKNSVYSMTQLNGYQIPELNTNNGPHSPPTQTSPSNPSASLNQPMSPTSPPKLTSSKSSISFYSYADLLSNDEFAKRPNFKQSYSQGIIPTARKNSAGKFCGSHSGSHSSSTNMPGVAKRFNSNLNKFLISPESSDSEDDSHSKLSGKSKITTSRSNDEESFISSSIGDCLRKTTTEINNS